MMHFRTTKQNFPLTHSSLRCVSGSAEVQYTRAQAEHTANGTVVVSARLLQVGLKPGADVPQLYVSFPDSIPGPDAAKPEWRLAGFRKIVLTPNVPQVAPQTRAVTCEHDMILPHGPRHVCTNHIKTAWAFVLKTKECRHPSINAFFHHIYG